ncbi:MAG TPA: Holliday junction branch migration protein RuvA [Candidatus Cryptobacteroides pullicola]|nr:Holliday junction branch migration protein RuvA [Candidatus Cryptobacteroides pullicola]
MIDYISGRLKTLTPTYAVIENSGIGYMVEISLQTYDFLSGKEDCTVYIQRQVNQRDGTEVDYGFSTREERELFRSITGVSGMGASSARMILSALSPSELKETILAEDTGRLKAIKGIGLKSAQRLVLELKDKMGKSEEGEAGILLRNNRNEIVEEATAALVNLGFARPNINKAVQAILKATPEASVEIIIKNALRML